MMYFYIVHIFKQDGYSFLVCSKEPLQNDEVIKRCKDKMLFYENRDAKDAYVDAFPMTEDIVRYKHYTAI